MPEKQDMIHLSALPVFEYRGQIVTNSRDVAALIGKPYKEIYTAIQQRLLTFGEITGTAALCLTPHNAPHGAFAVGECTDITETAERE